MLKFIFYCLDIDAVEYYNGDNKERCVKKVGITIIYFIFLCEGEHYGY